MLDARRTTEHYVSGPDRVLLDDTPSIAVARAGPGGWLCPGLNDVIRGLVRSLADH